MCEHAAGPAARIHAWSKYGDMRTKRGLARGLRCGTVPYPRQPDPRLKATWIHELESRSSMSKGLENRTKFLCLGGGEASRNALFNGFGYVPVAQGAGWTRQTFATKQTLFTCARSSARTWPAFSHGVAFNPAHVSFKPTACR